LDVFGVSIFKMRILFHLGHPAHFHLFINTIDNLKKGKHNIVIVIKKKDVLENLLTSKNINFMNIYAKDRGTNYFNFFCSQLVQFFKFFSIVRSEKPDTLVGTSTIIGFIGKMFRISSINVNEDDANVIPLYSYFSYPPSSIILSPIACNNSRWERKTIHYNGYHELAYFHPKYFAPDKTIVLKYLPVHQPYFLLRFAKLTAHHDKGIRGISTEIAGKIINLLKPHGSIFITSERELEPEFEKYRLNINPIDIHHVMAFSEMYLGDSQTMAAEAAVLGVPSIRYNDFVGKLGYLEELEHKFGLTFGVSPSEPEILFQTIKKILAIQNLADAWQNRRKKMLSEKIDVTQFMTWFIENYPESASIMQHDQSYQYKFK